MTIRRMLVANRGEIARRVFATCRELGISTVAVHSDADAGLPFVREADVAVRLPGSTPGDTYLRGDLLVQAALATGADAVHPGYGFLSESPAFARQVIAAGLSWVGPTPESMEQMASKVAAKEVMAAAGVPVLEGPDPAAVTEADLPLLVKASAGGGGRGMRVVRDLADVAAALEQASAEAASAFGDPTVFLEPYVERGRHLEVQVWGDRNRNVSVLGERDCSVQRRHQKIVEESPAGYLPPEVRERLHAAARAGAEAIGYTGVGTVEFLYDEESQRFWFLEMNTRLQVEHPVTEAVLGLDLVALQVEAVEGGRARAIHGGGSGHAVEARLYAEDPAQDYAPQAGRLTRLEIPGAVPFARTRDGIRVDAGYGSGDEVGTHYDAMLAKVVAWGPDRRTAVRRLAAALEQAEIHGVRTNRDLLVEVLRHPEFVEDSVDTGFLERHDLAALAPRATDPELVAEAAFAAAVVLASRAAATGPVQRGIPVGWRNVASQPQRTVFELDPSTGSGRGEEVVAAWYADRDGFRSADAGLRTPRAELSEGEVVLATSASDNSAGRRVGRRVRVHVDGDRVDVETPDGHVALTRRPRLTDPADQVPGGSMLAPMPGTIVRVEVAVGDTVDVGEPVLVLEAMKMQHTVSAPHHGVVTELPVDVGSHVAAGAVLAVVQEEHRD